MRDKNDDIRAEDRKRMTNIMNFAGDPYMHLAAEIIIKAYEDLRMMDGLDKCYFDGSPVSKEELLNFFCSKWCALLLSFQDNVNQNDLVQAALKICK